MSSRIGLIRGDNRYNNVTAAMDTIAADVNLAGVDSILVKPNLVGLDNPLAVTHVDAMRAVIAWLRSRTGAPIKVGEGTAFANTWTAYEQYGYLALKDEFRDVTLVDLNVDETRDLSVFNSRLRPVSVQASRLALDCPFRISVGPPKTHDTVLVTLGLKNMIMGSLVSRTTPSSGEQKTPAEKVLGKAVPFGEAAYNRLPVAIRTIPWVMHFREVTMARLVPSSKAAMHQGLAAMHLNLFSLAPLLYPHLSVLDGFEAMEGNGPGNGEPVAWRMAMAGTDWLAVDVTCAQMMGFDLAEVGYLSFCARACYGVADPENVQVIGNVLPGDLTRRFKRHEIEKLQNQWHSPSVSEHLQRTLAAGAN